MAGRRAVGVTPREVPPASSWHARLGEKTLAGINRAFSRRSEHLRGGRVVSQLALIARGLLCVTVGGASIKRWFVRHAADAPPGAALAFKTRLKTCLKPLAF